MYKLIMIGVTMLMYQLVAVAQFAISSSPLITEASELRSSFGTSKSDTIYLPIIEPQYNNHSEFRTLNIGENAHVTIDEETLGRWVYFAPSKQYIWSCTFYGVSASSLSLRLDNYQLPQGGRFYLRAEDGRIRGAYTERHNNEAQTLQFAPIEGRACTLIYEAPAGKKPGKRPFRIGAISQGYPYELTQWRGLERERYGFTYGEPFYDRMRATLSTLRCAPNVVGYPQYTELGRSVVLMITEGTTLSTGVLVNNSKRDATAYVLTSAHCINRLYQLDNLDSIKKVVHSAVFFFGFESPSADMDIRGNQELTLSGAELIAYEPEADMALLKIVGLPLDDQGNRYIPKSYRPYYAGWNLSASPSSPYIGVHHPVGSTKRISLSEGAIRLMDYSIPSRDIYWVNKHWYLARWSIGTTAAGSSGSPLFDATGHIIGALSGGRSTCSSPVSDYYWAIREVWHGASDTQSLRKWLDPETTGVQELDGYDPFSAQSVQRLSSLYAKSGVKHNAYTPNRGTSGLGRNIHISSVAKPLGVYLVFEGDMGLQNKFPSLIIELLPISDGQAQSSIWSTQVETAHFERYSSATNLFEKGIRTLGYGLIELFVPAIGVSSVPAGNYVLAVRTTNGEDFGLKLLSEYHRLTESNNVGAPWYLSEGGWYPKSLPPFQSYWIDLLTESTEPLSSLNRTVINHYEAYYYQGVLYILNPSKEQAYLNIYSLDGRLVQRDVPILEGESQVAFDYVPNTVYMAHIRGKHGERILKIKGYDR